LNDGNGLFMVNTVTGGKQVCRIVGKESNGITRRASELFIVTLLTKKHSDAVRAPHG
jgi:3-deoxy-D-manno-octulosonate 8-phosphate phosphatase KdsC-like HAD superfamily phosphatase